MVPQANEIITWAQAHKGVTEQPKGSNDGADLRAMLSNTAFHRGDAWCMFFAEAAVKAGFVGFASIPDYIALNGVCHDCAVKAARAGKLSQYAATGCIALFKGGQRGWHHAGIVIAVNEPAGQFTSIEGNTNSGGSIEGYEVAIHVHNRESADFVIW